MISSVESFLLTIRLLAGYISTRLLDVVMRVLSNTLKIKNYSTLTSCIYLLTDNLFQDL